jgi:hypothetical protein
MSDWPELEQRLIESACGRARRRLWRRPIVLAPTLAAVAAAAAFLLPSEPSGPIPADERPAPTPTASPDPRAAERRALQTPAPAPARLAASYAALADGKAHPGPRVARKTVTVHGTRLGGCIWVLPDGARGPGGSCFSEQDVKATNLWMTTGGILLVLVPDTATDITVVAPDGTQRRATATSNLVVAHRSDTVRYTASGKRTAVTATRPR